LLYRRVDIDIDIDVTRCCSDGTRRFLFKKTTNDSISKQIKNLNKTVIVFAAKHLKGAKRVLFLLLK